jgi:hypothetical protein
MPNATVGAAAPTLPDETETDAHHEDFERSQEFSRAYARRLRACAQIEVPNSEDEQFVKAGFAEERAALRELFLAPAACSETIWAKLAAFEMDLAEEMIAGPSKDSVLLIALGSIKADLMNLGIKGDI